MRTYRIFLIIIHLFVCVTAIIGGGILFLNTSSASLELLKGSPFDTYTIPAIILIAVIGGTNLAAAVLQSIKNRYKHYASAGAGFGLIIWIYTQTYILVQHSWLQTLYFSCGIAILAFVMLRLKLEKTNIDV